jgi:hypothetical protein
MRLEILKKLNMGHSIVGYSDVLPLNIVLFESFTRQGLPSLLVTHFVDDRMEKGIFRASDNYLFNSGSPQAVDGDIQICYIDGFLYRWLIDGWMRRVCYSSDSKRVVLDIRYRVRLVYFYCGAYCFVCDTATHWKGYSTSKKLLGFD